MGQGWVLDTLMHSFSQHPRITKEKRFCMGLQRLHQSLGTGPHCLVCFVSPNNMLLSSWRADASINSSPRYVKMSACHIATSPHEAASWAPTRISASNHFP